MNESMLYRYAALSLWSATLPNTLQATEQFLPQLRQAQVLGFASTFSVQENSQNNNVKQLYIGDVEECTLVTFITTHIPK